MTTLHIAIPSAVREKIERELVSNRVLIEVGAERRAQDEKWGEQNHPMIGGMFPEAYRNEWALQAARWKATNDYRVENETLGFDGIALEEVFEALEEADPVKQRAELVQAAAVFVAMIEAIDRKIATAEAA